MKKHYQAPEILFEDFSLSTNIAAGCEQVANITENVCGLKWGRSTVFTADMTGICNKTPEETGGLYDGLCYHVPTDANNLFTS